MTLTGYILTEQQADAVLAAIAQAFTSRDLPPYWTPGKYEIFSGEHAGAWFVPASDADLATPLQGNPVQTPRDFPEFAQIVAALGGLEARVELDAAAIVNPNIAP